ncbi:DGQHR domain-containing protein [Paenibacillus chondroitinus]|uniref:DGQHR domain-containing protein n=1 Tax=Paenibacillus chondroitinus TaxID=59842 RepID=A0ABU6DGN3_9BACL|nr:MULTISPECIES: DGQHR domain-containing protein [Paenibacillus]MCY9659521.1 DGQHR domain-containing protein [Paenibacillus anseongense]MEB4796916.1 DGQHR domain-containing protein [Paenibacillus chondroitinus]
MNTLPNQHAIENVIQYKMRGKVAYLGHMNSNVAFNLTYVKPYDMASGKGYQRPVDIKRCNDFALYLSKGENALFTPILLNAESKWEFLPYDKVRPNYGRLLCKEKASLMDGQHRLGGIKRYSQETNAELSVPFLAYHYLDEDEEIHLFNTINTKAKGIGLSLSSYLRRNSDDLSWVATELILRNDSPFHNIGTITGKRNTGRHVTLQNLYRSIELLTKLPHLSSLPKEDKLLLSLVYFNSIKDTFNQEWMDYKEYRITHIVCINALSIAGCELLSRAVSEDKKNIDYAGVSRAVKRLKKFDWSSSGRLKYIKGLSGSKTLAADLAAQMLPE